ncbi:hypothetical protein A5631_16760 [Mycolicibacter heraklionensis]|nr:hypothetical protein [Mycolicibacter heraklionensis]OBJ30047.1 hypothetical protein A5631_16760 [Mycolicibacter heraklionensis]
MTVLVGIFADSGESVPEAPKQVLRGGPALGNRKDIRDPHIRDQCRHLVVVVGPIGFLVLQGVGEDLNQSVPHQVGFPRSCSSRIQVGAGHGICESWCQ